MAIVAALIGSSGTASADVTSVNGSAYGYTLSVSLFGSPPFIRGVGQQTCTAPSTPPGCTSTPDVSDSPFVTLTSNASNSPEDDSEPSVRAQAGPADFFSSLTQVVHTEGAIGPSGYVTSTATINTTNTTNQEVLTAAQLQSRCTTLSPQGVPTSTPTGSTTITNGTLTTDNGLDLNN
ncbi:MAG: hypothetical protein LC708_03085, partial [Actinobacteria bacterium]|nr:hypothetical protein [Actinomycetota bacterium]